MAQSPPFFCFVLPTATEGVVGTSASGGHLHTVVVSYPSLEPQLDYRKNPFHSNGRASGKLNIKFNIIYKSFSTRIHASLIIDYYDPQNSEDSPRSRVVVFKLAVWRRFTICSLFHSHYGTGNFNPKSSAIQNNRVVRIV